MNSMSLRCQYSRQYGFTFGLLATDRKLTDALNWSFSESKDSLYSRRHSNHK
jgi:hypothetical protein